ncbi:MAG: glycerol-3-phosphate 1-O-acyltransferase PlsB [Gammaproteobacteria bacterium]|nr:MAG: glycerol-3-phosphate 1-O-acyltransferase PlsB [Gammaproteobacteria bacterium]
MRRLRALGYRISRRIIGWLVKPQLAGTEAELQLSAPEGASAPDTNKFIYVMDARSLSDLIVVDLVCERLEMPGPLEPIEYSGHTEERRFFFLSRSAGGWFRKDTMQTYSERMIRVLANADENCEASLLPVAVFWGRAPQKEGSIWRAMMSENWAVTSRLKRMASLIFSRKFIVVSYGTPIPLKELAGTEDNRVVRRAARLLRVRLRNQRVATLGPDFSHQRTLTEQILGSRAVRHAIENSDLKPAQADRRARKAVQSMASNMSFPTIRVLSRLLTWFWQEIYDGVEVHGMQRLQQVAESHTLVYVPSHRSHIDYLLLSYLLFYRGLMIPHIAAGENLNMPVVGSILRRGGAFFMRRQFRDDPIYSAVFSEYLYQVYRRGHCVEYFPEGGRSRTGRLLPARLGLIKMTLDCHDRGVPRPLAMVPVYFGYEKLIEASSYLDELRGTEKKRESIADIFRSLRLIREDFGKVDVNFGEPVIVDDWIGTAPENPPFALGQEVMLRINEAASINPVNLIALVTLSTPRFAVDESRLIEQIDCYLALLRADADQHDFTVTSMSGAEVVRYVEQLGMIKREHHEFGDILCHDPFNAVLMTWYRNNVAHTLALPALIACLVHPRRHPLNKLALSTMVDTVYPYIAEELYVRVDPTATDRWLTRMVELGLLELHPTGGYLAPPAGDPNQHRLELLSTIIQPTLERLYIVIALLASSTEPGSERTRESLQDDSRKIAQKMSRIYGLNAPEFFDARLFNLFVDKLVADGVINEREDGTLTHTAIVDDVLKAAQAVINSEFRYAILREG